MKNRERQNHTAKPTKEEITRKEALKKAGKYAAVTAAGMFMILNPKESQIQRSRRLHQQVVLRHQQDGRVYKNCNMDGTVLNENGSFL